MGDRDTEVDVDGEVERRAGEWPNARTPGGMGSKELMMGDCWIGEGSKGVEVDGDVDD